MNKADEILHRIWSGQPVTLEELDAIVQDAEAEHRAKKRFIYAALVVLMMSLAAGFVRHLT